MSQYKAKHFLNTKANFMQTISDRKLFSCFQTPHVTRKKGPWCKNYPNTYLILLILFNKTAELASFYFCNRLLCPENVGWWEKGINNRSVCFRLVSIKFCVKLMVLEEKSQFMLNKKTRISSWHKLNELNIYIFFLNIMKICKCWKGNVFRYAADPLSNFLVTTNLCSLCPRAVMVA